MKYVIYGAGKRGKFAFDLLGEDNVYAFVDQDEDKIGSTYCNVPVVSVNTLKDRNQEFIWVISPYKGIEEIELYLEENRITNYIKMQRVDIVLKQCKKYMETKIACLESGKKVLIYGISIASLLIYEMLRELGHQAMIVIEDEKDIMHYSFLKRRYNISLFEEAIDACDFVIYLESDIKGEYLKKINYKVDSMNIKEVFEEQLETRVLVQKYRNKHVNDRCFIVATGPSLRVEDLDTLKANNEICISMNRIYNIFDKTMWRPNYYMIQDLKMIEDLKETIAELDLPVKFVSGSSQEYWRQKISKESIKFNYVSFIEMNKKPFFSSRVDKCIYEGMTVTYACLQMAVYMGFKEIYLLGLDHNYSSNLYAGSNHFAGYDTDKTIRLNTVYIEQNELAYISAREYAEQHGIKIYNATRGGKLEVFERKDFDSLF